MQNPDTSSPVVNQTVLSREVSRLFGSRTQVQLFIFSPWREHYMSKRLILLSLVLLLLPALLTAQVSTTGKIAGIVIDPSDAGVVAVTITVKSPALLAQRSMQTAADGSYLFDLLPPGTYELTVAAPGFRSYRETGIVITAGFTATINPKLAVGEVTQTITVESEPVVDLQSVQTST